MKGAVSQVVTSLGENPTLQITTVKLDGLNYLAWSQSALLSIKSRGKIGFLNGKIQEPQPNDPAYDKWEAENSTVMSWLLHSMQPKISQGTYFSIWPKKFEMLLLKHIPKWGMMH
jgi:hypothetical protein